MPACGTATARAPDEAILINTANGDMNVRVVKPCGSAKLCFSDHEVYVRIYKVVSSPTNATLFTIQFPSSSCLNALP